MAEAKFTYEIINKEKKTIRIKQAQSVTEEVVIPEKVVYYKQEYTVTEIGGYAFYETSLKSVIIPNSVTRIGGNAFLYCSNLEHVVLSDSIEGIGEGAFAGCPNVDFSGKIPSKHNGAIIINGVLIARPKGVSEYVIPDGVTRIGRSAFSDCLSLTSIIIPDSVTEIGSNAFGRTNISSITIPASVKRIDGALFAGCSKLIRVMVEDANTVYDSRNNCDAIIESNSNSLISGCSSTIIPTGVASIGDGAFNSCGGLTSITIPESVKSIGKSAFSRCTNLNDINIPEGITSIGDDVFFNCIRLTAIILPESVTSIGRSAFVNCSSLTSITIPASVTSIGDEAFRFCSNLSAVYISSIESWRKISFGNCYSKPMYDNLYLNGELLTDLEIPAGAANKEEPISSSTPVKEEAVKATTKPSKEEPKSLFGRILGLFKK